MDNFIQGLKKKLSVDNLIDMMKEADVIGEDKVREEEVRRTLTKVDPNSLVDIDDMANKLNDVPRKADTSKTKQVLEVAKSGIDALQKLAKSEPSEPKKEQEEVRKEYSHPYIKEDNLFNLNDDFR